MLIATATMSVLLAAAPAAMSQQAATQQHQRSNSSATTCAHCAARHASTAVRASATKPGWVMTRRDNPHSTVVEEESAVPVHSPTNNEINAAESGNPDSVDFRYSNVGSTGTGNLDLEALEAENPHNAQPGRHAAVVAVVADTSSAVKCSCMVSDARR